MRSFLWKDSSFRVMQVLVVVGIAVSVAALIVTLAVARGFQREYTRALLNFNADVMVMFPDEKEMKDLQIPPQKEVTHIAPYLYREALAVQNGKVKGVVLKGTDVEGVEVGNILYEALGRPTTLRLLLGTSSIQTIPVQKSFSVGLYEYDSQFIKIPLSMLRKLTGEGKALTGFEMKLQDPYAATAVAERLREQLPPAVEVVDWTELNADIFKALKMEQGLFSILLGLLVFIASLNLIAAILIQIFYKRRAIGILQALGMTPAGIHNIFIRYGIGLGAVGGICGLFLACGVGLLIRAKWVPLDASIYFIDALPIDFHWGWATITTFFAVALAGIVSWIAAARIGLGNVRENLHGPA